MKPIIALMNWTNSTIPGGGEWSHNRAAQPTLGRTAAISAVVSLRFAYSMTANRRGDLLAPIAGRSQSATTGDCFVCTCKGLCPVDGRPTIARSSCYNTSLCACVRLPPLNELAFTLMQLSWATTGTTTSLTSNLRPIYTKWEHFSLTQMVQA